MTTHVYGRAEYHPRRTTTSTAEQGGTSPKKKFRTKRALESVQGKSVPVKKLFVVIQSYSLCSRLAKNDIVGVVAPPMLG